MFSAESLGKLAAGIISLGGKAVGTALGGPAGAIIAEIVTKPIADAIGAPEATPEAVTKRLEEIQETAPDNARRVIEEVDRQYGPQAVAVQEAYNRQLEIITADIQNARSMNLQLVSSGSPLSWFPVAYSTAMVLTFIAVLFSFLFKVVGLDQSVRDILMMMLGILTGEVKQVGSYYLGSSAGSAVKDRKLDAQQMNQPPLVALGTAAGQMIGDAVKKATSRG